MGFVTHQVHTHALVSRTREHKGEEVMNNLLTFHAILNDFVEATNILAQHSKYAMRPLLKDHNKETIDTSFDQLLHRQFPKIITFVDKHLNVYTVHTKLLLYSMVYAHPVECGNAFHRSAHKTTATSNQVFYYINDNIQC